MRVVGIDRHPTGSLALLEVHLHPSKAAIGVEESGEVVILQVVGIPADLKRQQLPSGPSHSAASTSLEAVPASAAASSVTGAACTAASVRSAVVGGVVLLSVVGVLCLGLLVVLLWRLLGL